jgi:hypothetical protein
MDLKDILAISGFGGLFKFISQGRNGIIVESFANKKRTFVNATTKVSSLSEIAIFTDDEEVSLSDVFKNIFQKENGGKTIDPKSSNEALKSYMAEILPNYDKDRVYVSDIRKLVSWYDILHDNNLLVFEDEKKESDEKEPAKDITKAKSSQEKEKKSTIKKTAQKPTTTSKTTPAKKAQMMTRKKTG